MTNGKVVLVPFPFDDLSTTKVRPAAYLRVWRTFRRSEQKARLAPVVPAGGSIPHSAFRIPH